MRLALGKSKDENARTLLILALGNGVESWIDGKESKKINKIKINKY